MLTTKILYSAGETKRYYSSDRSKDYYVSEDRQAVVSGELAKMLGIDGFDKKQFFALCDGLNPVTGKSLTAKPRKGEKRRVALDATVGVPKSVTDMIALLGDERAFDAVSRANQDVLRLMEADACVRERAGGADYDRPTGNFICYSFYDPTSRPEDGTVDPHTHWHNVIFNATYDPVKGRIMALQLQKWDDNGLKLYRPYYQAYFNNQLRKYLEEIGYKTRDTEHAFEIDGVPQAAIDEFSRRTQTINSEAERRGITDPGTKGRLGAKLRQGKIPLQPWDKLVEGWKRRLAPDTLEAMERTYAESLLPHDPPELEDKRAMDYALEHLHYRRSAVPERELLIEAMKFRMGRTTLDGLLAELDRPGLIREEKDGVHYVTSTAIKAEEDAVVGFATVTRGKHSPLGKAGAKVPKFLPGTQFKPTKSQAAAIQHIWKSKDPVTLVLGKPGAGKTEMLKAALAQLRVNHVVIAPTATASRENLADAGFRDAETVAAFFRSEDLQAKARGGLIVVDEGSLTGSVDAARLVKLADQLNSRLLVLGDRMQHKAPSRGDTLGLLVRHAKLPFAHLSEIVRQKGELLQAVEMLHAGDGTGGIRELDRQGRVRVGTVEDVAAAYVDAVSYEDKQGVRRRKDKASVLVISPTHAEGRNAASAIRASLRDAGLLAGEDVAVDTLRPLQVTPAEMREKLAPGQVALFYRRTGRFKPGEKVAVTAENLEELRGASTACYSLHLPDVTRVAAGDRIRTTNNAEVRGGRVQNGSLYEVAGIDDGQIRLTNGLVLPKGFQNFTQGYVVTSPASQSKTVQTQLIWQPASTRGATGLEQALVSVSRGAKDVTIFTDSKDWLPRAAQKTDDRVLASDLVREARKVRLRERLKSRVAFLRRIVHRGRDHQPERVVEQERGMEHAR